MSFVLHGAGDADLLQQTHRGAIARRTQRGSERQRGPGRVLILRRPCALQGCDRLVEVIDHGGRGIARLDRGRVDERLESGSGLAMRLNRPVEVSGIEVAAADHCPHVPGVWLERHESALARRPRAEAARVPRSSRASSGRAASLPCGAACSIDLICSAMSLRRPPASACRWS
jgi:hypothetical protein